ncbi:MAG: hypothetical protein N2379_10180, partial [Verrucomicrobiae bacterium]|nr:hypothetical protein [Verrucomicrobiae bacterium]
MEKSAGQSTPEHSELKDQAMAVELELPVDPEFASLPAKVDLKAMLRRIEENMPWRSSRPGERERRLASKVDVEFVL